MVHDTSGGGENDETELTSWEELDNPLLEVVKTDVVAWGDDTSLVEAAVKLDDDLAGAVVIDLLELSDVTWERKSVCLENLKVRKLIDKACRRVRSPHNNLSPT